MHQDKKRASGKRRPAAKKQDMSQREQSARDLATPSKKDELMNNEEQNEAMKNSYPIMDRLPTITKRNAKEHLEARNNTFSFNQEAGEEEKKQTDMMDENDLRAFPFANMLGHQKATPE